jgi:uncharacterized protein YjiS (DUF1127 family)
MVVFQAWEDAMSMINRQTKRIATWPTRAAVSNDLTTLSDRDLRDIGLVRWQVSINTCKLFWLV